MNNIENITIKKALKNDIPSILELLYDLGRPKSKNNAELRLFEQKISKYLLDLDKQIIVAKLDTNVIGVVSIMFLTRLNRKTCEMYIPELIVAKKYQRKAVGKNLVKYCFKIAKREKCHRIRLESGNQRVRSHKFYLKMGFEHTSHSFTKNMISNQN